MRKQAGFTLIELVMVIVILGILAATALPRFANLQVNARVAARDGVLGGVRAASAIAHAQGLVSGVSNGDVTLEGQAITLVNGYPDTTDIVTAAQVDGATVAGAGTALVSWTIDGNANCTVTYAAAPANGAPTIAEGGDGTCN